MKRFVLPFALMTIWAILTAAGCKQELGFVDGKVEFRGVPCQPGQTDFKVPPCSGPYPNYEVKIFRPDTGTEPVLSIKTGPDGRFRSELPPGDYVIRTQHGLMEKDQKENKFSIRAKENTPLPLVIYTGIQ